MAEQEVSCACPAIPPKGFMSCLIQVFIILTILQSQKVLTSIVSDSVPIINIQNSYVVQNQGNVNTSSNFEPTSTIPIINSPTVSSAINIPDKMTSLETQDIVSESLLLVSSEKTFIKSTFVASSSFSVVSASITSSLMTDSLSPSVSLSPSNSKIVNVTSSVVKSSSVQSSMVSSEESSVIISTSLIQSSVLNVSSCSLTVTTLTVCSSNSILYSSFHPSSSIAQSSSVLNTTLYSSMQPSSISSHTKTISISSVISSRSSILTSIVSSLIASSAEISPSLSSITVQSAHILKPALHKCDIVADEFSKSLNNYTTCVLLNLKPMEVCFSCLKQYDTLKTYHRKIYHDCGKELIGNYNHRYQVIAQIFEIQKQSWDSLQCEKCYNRNSPSAKMTPKFKRFKKLNVETKKCFAEHTPHYSNVTNNSSISTNGSVCIQCQPIYSELQTVFKFQEDSEENTDTNWCADINVVVNATRHAWSVTYKCGKKDKDLMSIIALTCFFCFLPIVFYVGAKLHADVKERKTNRYYESD